MSAADAGARRSVHPLLDVGASHSAVNDVFSIAYVVI
jgi:hypothetical protein